MPPLLRSDSQQGGPDAHGGKRGFDPWTVAPTSDLMSSYRPLFGRVRVLSSSEGGETKPWLMCN